MAVDIFPEETKDIILEKHSGNLCARSIQEAIKILYEYDGQFHKGYDSSGNSLGNYSPGFPDNVILMEIIKAKENKIKER